MQQGESSYFREIKVALEEVIDNLGEYNLASLEPRLSWSSVVLLL